MKTHHQLNFDKAPHVIHIEHDLDDYPCYEANAQLIAKEKVIANLFVRDDLTELLDTLTACAYGAINKTSPHFFHGNIGLAWNNRLYDSVIHNCPPKNLCEKKELNLAPSPMWSTPQGINSWLYWSGTEIIFEVTNSYPWFFKDPKPREKYYSYEEFLKNYTPIFKETISQQTAQEWFDKALSWYPDPRLLPRPFFK